MLRTAGLLCAVVTSVAACSSDNPTDPIPATVDDATNTVTDATQDAQDGVDVTQGDDGQDVDVTQGDDGQDVDVTQGDDGQDVDVTQGDEGQVLTDSRDLTARIITLYESPDSLEAWSCVPSSGPLYLYQFFAAGSGPDLNSEQSGVVIRSGDFDDDNRQGFGWGATSPDALLLDIPEQGEQIDWTSIRFQSDQVLTLNSSIRGNMRCSRIEN